MDGIDDDPDDTAGIITNLTQQPKKKRSRKNNFDSVIEVMSDISNKKMDMLMNMKDNDVSPEIRDFFLSISRTVEKFTTYNQAIIKKRIFDMVNEFEIGMLNGPSNSSAPNYYSGAWQTNNYAPPNSSSQQFIHPNGFNQNATLGHLAPTNFNQQPNHNATLNHYPAPPPNVHNLNQLADSNESVSTFTQL